MESARPASRERCQKIFIRIREEKQSYAQVAEEIGYQHKDS